jgi:hypothetical protein
MTLIYIPPFQNWLGERIASSIGEQLHTTAHIKGIQISFPNRMIIDGVSILDQNSKEMLRIGRLSTKLQFLPLAEGRFVISSIQLFGAHANIYKPDSLSPLNIQFAIDALSSNDTTSQTSIDLRVNSFIVRHSSLTYNQIDAPTKEHFDTKHLKLSDISSHIILKVLNEDSLNINIKRLTLNEKSGLKINNFALSFQAGKRNALLSHFALQLPNSQLTIDTIACHYRKDMINRSLRFRGNEIKGNIRLNDLAAFHPILNHYPEEISIHAAITGAGKSLHIPRLNISSTDRNLQLACRARIASDAKGVLRWQANVSKFIVAESIIKRLTDDISILPQQLKNIGSLYGEGYCSGSSEGDLETKSAIHMDAGQLSADMKITSDKVFSGKIKTKDINLHRLLENDQLGMLTANISFNGTISQFSTSGEMERFDYKGYPYRNIRIDGTYATRHIAGKAYINDPNISTYLEGKWTEDGLRKAIRLTGGIENIAPKALGLSDEWGDATFRGTIDVDLTAKTLNDIEGTLDIDDFVMNDSTGFMRIDNVHVKSGFRDKQHFLKFDGDFGEGELTGTFDINTLTASLKNCLRERIPSMPGLGEKTIATQNNFNLRMRIKNSEWLRRILNIPLVIESPITITGNLNDLTHEINLAGSSLAFFYDGTLYENAMARLVTSSNSLLCQGQIVKHMDNDIKMDVSLDANATHDKIDTHLAWNNHTDGLKNMRGDLNLTTYLYTNDEGLPEAQIHTHSSQLSLGDAQWNILPCDIIYNSNRLLVDHFQVQHDQQHLIVDGIASKNENDIMSVDMNRLDVSYVLDLLNFHPVEFAGFVSGRAHATHLFDEPQASADIRVDGFHFENGSMGTLYAKAEWNTLLQQIDIHAVADEGNEGRTLIDGFVSPVRSDIELNIKGEGTNIEFLQTYTTSFLKNVSGRAYGDVKLVGPLGAMDLLGTLVVDGEATVIPLGTTYTLKKDTVRLVRDDIQLNRAVIYDINGDSAYLSGGIHHENLSNMTFDLDVETSKFLAYDFKELNDDLFCGTVEASGKVYLQGRPGEIIINCNATPLQSTIFTYNAAQTDAVSNQEFITWKNRRSASKHKEENMDSEEDAGDIPTDIYINFLINANPNATVKLLMDANTGDHITLYGSGVLRASYHNKGAFQMFGTYNIERGTYGITIQNIIKKNFVFEEGSTIVFGGNPMEASLQMRALYTVNGVSLSDLNIGNTFSSNTVRVNCLMNITGQAGSPRVDFDLDMPNVNSEEKQMVRSVITSEQEMNQQVLYLLGIGRFYTQGVNNAETQQYGQTELAMQSFLSGTLSTQINELISQVFKNDDWNFGANISTGNEGWHNAEYEGQISGRMLNNRLLINGQFGYRDNATQATPSFIGDFDIRYMLMPNGNLALKMYNQTNDRYFTRSSLNTQGLGLIIKKDFNGLGDFFSRRKKK